MNKRALLERICNSKTIEEAWNIIINEWNYIQSSRHSNDKWWEYYKFLNTLIGIFKEALKDGD
jgi:hypothetical protein